MEMDAGVLAHTDDGCVPWLKCSAYAIQGFQGGLRNRGRYAIPPPVVLAPYFGPDTYPLKT
jgi:hypothetical protein